jgi:hypothetical protein
MDECSTDSWLECRLSVWSAAALSPIYVHTLWRTHICRSHRHRPICESRSDGSVAIRDGSRGHRMEGCVRFGLALAGRDRLVICSFWLSSTSLWRLARSPGLQELEAAWGRPAHPVPVWRSALWASPQDAPKAIVYGSRHRALCARSREPESALHILTPRHGRNRANFPESF